MIKESQKKTEELGTTFDLIPQRGYVGASRLGHREHSVHSVHGVHGVIKREKKN